VQKDRIEVEVVGLGLEDESWGIEKRVIQGDTEQDDVWQDLGQFLESAYERDDGVRLKIVATAIDMRHKPKKVQAFCRKSGLARVYPVYGVGGVSPILVTTRFNKHYRLRTYAVQGKLAKDIIFARLRVTEPGPRYMHFPKGHGYDEEHFLQLTAEVLKTKYTHGFPTQFYEKIRDRNEALDLRVYWLACLDILKPALTAIAKNQKGPRDHGTTGPRDHESQKPKPRDYELKPAADDGPVKETQAPEPKVEKPKPKPRKPFRPGGGFVGGWKK
jgi:phage terminase large subunit GpA-like protein